MKSAIYMYSSLFFKLSKDNNAFTVKQTIVLPIWFIEVNLDNETICRIETEP